MTFLSDLFYAYLVRHDSKNPQRVNKNYKHSAGENSLQNKRYLRVIKSITTRRGTNASSNGNSAAIFSCSIRRPAIRDSPTPGRCGALRAQAIKASLAREFSENQARVPHYHNITNAIAQRLGAAGLNRGRVRLVRLVSRKRPAMDASEEARRQPAERRPREVQQRGDGQRIPSRAAPALVSREVWVEAVGAVGGRPLAEIANGGLDRRDEIRKGAANKRASECESEEGKERGRKGAGAGLSALLEHVVDRIVRGHRVWLEAPARRRPDESGLTGPGRT